MARKPDAPMPDLRECVFVITPKLNCNAKKEFQRVRKKEEVPRAFCSTIYFYMTKELPYSLGSKLIKIE